MVHLKEVSGTGGTTPIYSCNFPPVDAGMRCGDNAALATLMGFGIRALGPTGGPPAGPVASAKTSDGLRGLVAAGEASLQLGSQNPRSVLVHS